MKIIYFMVIVYVNYIVDFAKTLYNKRGKIADDTIGG